MDFILTGYARVTMSNFFLRQTWRSLPYEDDLWLEYATMLIYQKL
jgi:hypothetical protein